MISACFSSGSCSLCPTNCLVKLIAVPSQPRHHAQISRSALVTFSQKIRQTRKDTGSHCWQPSSFSNYDGPGLQFEPVSEKAVHDLIVHSPVESFCLDPISASVAKQWMPGRPCSSDNGKRQPLPLHWYGISSVQTGCCDATLKETLTQTICVDQNCLKHFRPVTNQFVCVGERLFWLSCRNISDSNKLIITIT